ncbi:hypothetical protein B0H14DRAFT_3521647 [Mycena olivaceomarginata]|nr:hypothetical protein B0H14DRAFT_3521647 [Mycena olivaceomarginata]
MALSGTPSGVVLNLTKNRNEDVPLGSWDSKVGAVVHIDGKSYFITTNTNYIPAVPIQLDQNVFLREDMRYGEDDPTLWPQNYGTTLCHLGTIHKKPVGTKREISVMWWNPTSDDFSLLDTGLTVTRSLGKLRSSKVTQLMVPLQKLFKEYKTIWLKLAKVHDFNLTLLEVFWSSFG